MDKPQTTRRTQAERTRASKEKIIQAACQYFAEQGYHGAKMSDIARAANLTEPGLLHHFPSKTHLLMAVLAERDRADGERFDTTPMGEKSDLFAALEKLVAYNQSVPGLVQLFTILVAESIQQQHPGHPFFKERYQAAREQNVLIIQQMQDQGEIRADIPAEDLAILLYAVMDGLQIQWLYEPEKVDMARIFQHFVRLVRGKTK
jgi:AcrR family transcriptional regulator